MHPSARPLRDVQRPRVLAVPTLLQVGVHALVAALVVWVAVHGVLSASPRLVTLLTVTVAVALVYGIGPFIPAVARTVAGSGIWLTTLIGLWIALLVLTPDAMYLAFPWFFLILHLLPWRAGLYAVGATTAVAIAGFAWHRGGLDAGSVIGPTLGALVAIAAVWGFTAVAAESDRRRELIDELRRTQAELATVERAAGAARERERLAREIHDTLAQGLSSIQLLLAAAVRALPGAESTDGVAPAAAVNTARERIEQARRAAQDNLAEARRFVAELTPPSLNGQSLAAALERLCQTVSGQSAIPVRFATAGADGTGTPTALPTPIEVTLLRVAQSALANVTQHSSASAATVTLTLTNESVMLDIVDDGMGFAPERLDAPGAAAGATGGFGLPAMRARVTELGGGLSVESEPGHGTAVGVTIPLMAGSS